MAKLTYKELLQLAKFTQKNIEEEHKEKMKEKTQEKLRRQAEEMTKKIQRQKMEESLKQKQTRKNAEATPSRKTISPQKSFSELEPNPPQKTASSNKETQNCVLKQPKPKRPLTYKELLEKARGSHSCLKDEKEKKEEDGKKKSLSMPEKKTFSGSDSKICESGKKFTKPSNFQSCSSSSQKELKKSGKNQQSSQERKIPSNSSNLVKFLKSDHLKLKTPPKNEIPFKNRNKIQKSPRNLQKKTSSDFSDEGEDVSSLIREMFGYDRSRYAEEDSCSDMEVGFSQIDREERRTALIGKKEDQEVLEDEEAERARIERLKRLKRKQ